MATEREQLKQDAFDLYMLGWMQNRIANTLKITEKTISDWSKKGHWAEKRREELASSTARIATINKIIDHQIEVLQKFCEDNPDKMLDSKHPDGLFKLHSMVKSKKMDFPQIAEIIGDLVEFVSKTNPDLAKQLLPLADEFLIISKNAL